jgi:2-oxoacid:acceptor oxidoreductase gamma subunit (pyruvate/2-ketoisovalerate family)
MGNDIIEIRLHGRGGQGAITSAKIMAKGALRAGYKGVVMVPSFGTERRGAPVLTSLKIADEKIYDLSDSESPDIVIVLDHSILADENVLEGLKPGGTLIINTPNSPESYNYDGIKVAVADVTAISGEAELTYGTVSSGIVGAFAKASPLVSMGTLAEVIREEFEGRKPEENARAALLTYERTRCSEVKNGNKGM